MKSKCTNRFKDKAVYKITTKRSKILKIQVIY